MARVHFLIRYSEDDILICAGPFSEPGYEDQLEDAAIATIQSDGWQDGDRYADLTLGPDLMDCEELTEAYLTILRTEAEAEDDQIHDVDVIVEDDDDEFPNPDVPLVPVTAMGKILPFPARPLITSLANVDLTSE